mmetsp:Transcript_22489/g.27498  ORF Transcript_22489/g.27498 Transcript_22489/m.27498 type:complete len:858 (+) Transcript_22489:400-2973(+)|eukprot:CAMPEP_0204822128 /NCGR_PEP_ID=MMETSP1346-20131115/291_1 /ASSEMBLY_ACC=CAM_ASM_000771 /TAXON_ID=215587 /ORGANISM="Aplanochytrium stocchinoi, Strain GSBS06" /LENGTH=857 /DNA_ID=CAMNT_0051948167 /DNA_START=316 /DNA_END=2889 /DNA_ORIENTATION=-
MADENEKAKIGAATEAEAETETRTGSPAYEKQPQPQHYDALVAASSAFSAQNSPNKPVFKQECPFSFATQFNPDGLYLNLATLQGYGKNFVGIDHDRTGNLMYVQLQNVIEQKLVEIPEDEQPSPFEQYFVKKNEEGKEIMYRPVTKIHGTNTLIMYPHLNEGVRFALNANSGEIDSEYELPETMLQVLKDLFGRFEAENRRREMERLQIQKQLEAQRANAGQYQKKAAPVSKFAKDLVQLDNGVKISSQPTTWKCADSGLTENLWLNLSTGYIGSGRPQWDGSGGTGAALRHYEDTGRQYPLCVKLGTITQSASGMPMAEVYSYDNTEDCMVTDPYIEKHLDHFGLKLEDLEKTEKTLEEQEGALIDRYIYSEILMDGDASGETKLEPYYAGGNIGLVNMGNTCYQNSVLQVLLSLEDFQRRYYYGTNDNVREQRYNSFRSAPIEPYSSLTMQMIKLAAAISDPEALGVKFDASKTSTEENEKENKEVETDESGLKVIGHDHRVAVAPRMLREAACSLHYDYMGNEQQDCVEYFRFMINKFVETDGMRPDSPGFDFAHVVEERLFDQQSQQVKYKYTPSSVLQLVVPIHKATNLKEVNAFKQRDKSKEDPKNKPRAVLPNIPFQECLKHSLGMDPNAQQTIVDYISPVTGERGIATQTVQLSTFPKYLCVQLRRFIMDEKTYQPVKTVCEVEVPRILDLQQYRGKGPQEHEVIIQERNEEETAEKELPAAKKAMVEQLMMMGFPEDECKEAALACNNVDAAMNWLFDPSTRVPLENPAERGEKAVETIKELNDGSSKYRLRAFISHLGHQINAGHYVCHTYDDKLKHWVLKNDTKVSVSKNPPIKHGYVYFYERMP